jgi:cytochrome c oxidase cbb3-type subunit 3
VGLPLMRQMLYPSAAGSSAATLTVTTENGERHSGALAYRDEFTVALRDANGAWRSWSTRNISYDVDDPREAHVEQLSRYTDEDMHNVLAFLQSLR